MLTLERAHVNANWHAEQVGALNVEIITQRLKIKSIRLEDFDNCIKLFGDPNLMSKYCEGVARSANEIEKYVRERWKRWQDNKPLSSLIIFTKEANEFVGHIDLDETNTDSEIELGYIILAAFQGKGYAQEAANAMIQDYLPRIIENKYRVKDKPIKSVIALAQHDNVKSIKILKSLGMEYVENVKKYNNEVRHFYCLSTDKLNYSQKDELTDTSKKIVNVKEPYKISDFIKGVAAPQEGQLRYILTGGPGAGKTSIINFLAKCGYLVAREAATEIIEDGLKKNIEKPWKSDDYHIRMYELISKKQMEVQNSSALIAFFDRGHLDGISYILLQKRTLYQCVVDSVQSSIDIQYFNNKVFFIDSLGFVVPGPARDEDLQESLQKAHCLEQNYRMLGYEIVHIPPGAIEERAQLIIDYVKKWNEEK